ncbi:hypothetical protein GALMADRAFT_559896, partial [Galerina marginata CBS 339.88]
MFCMAQRLRSSTRNGVCRSTPGGGGGKNCFVPPYLKLACYIFLLASVLDIIFSRQLISAQRSTRVTIY